MLVSSANRATTRICLIWVTFSTRLFIMLTPQKPCFSHIALTQFIRLPYTIVLIVALWLPLCDLHFADTCVQCYSKSCVEINKNCCQSKQCYSNNNSCCKSYLYNCEHFLFKSLFTRKLHKMKRRDMWIPEPFDGFLVDKGGWALWTSVY